MRWLDWGLMFDDWRRAVSRDFAVKIFVVRDGRL